MSVWVNEVNDEGGTDGVPGLVVDDKLGLNVSAKGEGVGAVVGNNNTGGCIVAWGNDWVSTVDMVATLVGLVRVDSRTAIETLAAWLNIE